MIFRISAVIGSGHAPTAQEFAKKGCPSTFRAQIWELILGTEIDDIVSTSLLRVACVRLSEYQFVMSGVCTT